MGLKIKKILVSAITLLSIAFVFASSPVAAVDCKSSSLTTKQAIQCGTDSAAGSTQPPSEAQDSLNNTITKIINILSVIVGVIAVIMLIFGGFRYVTSSGDATRVASAKNTLLYALIGLIIAALAQVIARFVLKQTTQV